MANKKHLKISRYALAYVCGFILALSHLFFWSLIALSLGERIFSILILPMVIYFFAGWHIFWILVDKISGEFEK